MIPRLTELQPASDATRRFLAEVRSRGFTGDLADDLATRVVGATDNSIYQILPQAIVYPRSQADVVLLLRTAQEAGFEGLTFTARGGGTGTNGQSLTSGVIIDLGRHLRAIGPLDLAAGWVEVEPGVVLDELNAFLEPHGVFFAPNLSPSSRATLGGMVSTDASGQGSRVYGKTSEHVLGLDVVLADGSVLQTRPWTADEAARAAAAPGEPGRVVTALLDLGRAERERFAAAAPRLRRFVTGYDLVHAFDPATGLTDLGRLVCGAEGTLGIVTRARLRLTPIPAARRLVALEFPTFEAALASATALVSVNPSSIETIDDKVMGLAREDVLWDSVKSYLGPDAKALNLVELEDTDVATVEARLAAMLATLEARRGEPGWPSAWKVAASEADRKALWQLRAKGVGLLGNTKGRRKPVPFVEDTVVPPERLAEYVAEFRAILEAEGLTYGMFGHVDVGCLHVRPALDLRDPEDEKRIRRISDRVAALCDKFGGVIWGEHGKGFRSEYSPLHFGDAYPVVRAVKRVFDPRDRLNPGKIAVAGDAALATIDQPLRGHADRGIARPSQDDFAIALDCNGNGQCYHWDPGHVMCPSSKVTRDRVHTPKGRAGVMREWLRQLSGQGVVVTKAARPGRVGQVLGWPARAWNTAVKRYDYSREVHRAMDGCLSCKACATQCPVKVDVPSFRAHFLEQYHTRYLRKPSDVLVGRLEGALRFMAKLPLVFNFFLGRRWFQRIFGAVSGLVDTPLLARPTLRRRLRERGLAELDWRSVDGGAPPPDKTVYLLQDAFTTFYEPGVVLAARDVLEAVGWRPVLVPFFPNGKGLHVKGFLGRFDKTVRRNVALLERLGRTGAPIVGIEPAVVLTYRDEYVAAQRAAGREAPKFKVELLQEFLAARVGPPAPRPAGAGPRPRYRLFGHCTEKTLALASQRQWAAVFLALGLDLELVDAGCCGMSGAFGHEKRHQAESRGIFDLSWARWIPDDAAARERITASGYSCRSQVERFAGFAPRHPIEILAAQLAAARAEASLASPKAGAPAIASAGR